MNRIALWINVRADDWAAEIAAIASNDFYLSLGQFLKPLKNYSFEQNVHVIIDNFKNISSGEIRFFNSYR